MINLIKLKVFNSKLNNNNNFLNLNKINNNKLILIINFNK